MSRAPRQPGRRPPKLSGKKWRRWWRAGGIEYSGPVRPPRAVPAIDGGAVKSRFWAVGLACFLLFCVAPAGALAASISGKITAAVGGAPIPHAQACVRDV